jgi:uncharacterized FlaG/YvyC family protein
MHDPRQATDAIRPLLTIPGTGSQIEQVKELAEAVRAVQWANKSELGSLGSGKRYSFSVDNASRRPVVEVMDGESGEVLYQIPPEEILRWAADIRRQKRETSECEKIVDGF